MLRVSSAFEARRLQQERQGSLTKCASIGFLHVGHQLPGSLVQMLGGGFGGWKLISKKFLRGSSN